MQDVKIGRLLLVNVGHFVSGILKGMPYRIMHLTLLTHLFSFNPDLFFLISRHPCYCHWANLLMSFSVPCAESSIVRSSSARLPKQELRVLCSARTCSLGLSKNSSIEMFFGRPSAWYKRSNLFACY